MKDALPVVTEAGIRRWKRFNIGGAVLSAVLTGAAMASGGLLPAACADCFFRVQGQLLECETTTAVAGAAISVYIDKGSHGPRALSMTFTTDEAGRFKVHTDATEICDATATLTFEKEGYTPLQKVYKGSAKGASVCLSRVAGTP